MSKNGINRHKITNNSWQDFQSVVQTIRWDEVGQDSDEKLAEIENDIREIRNLLGEPLDSS